ncbi:MAG: hypothetical protein WCB31_07935 [Nitrososphaeraceae archaeon]
MAIEWDSLVIEMILLAGIIWFAVYIEHWAYKRTQQEEDKKIRSNIFLFIKNDLEQRLRFIEESINYKDYKPFFTDMWDAIILSGKHSLLSFELFQNIQRTYSWMKYYNNELENNKNSVSKEKILVELLQDVKKYINKSLNRIEIEIERKSIKKK